MTWRRYARPVLFVPLLFPSPASACSCFGTDPLVAVVRSDVVFSGTVARVEEFRPSRDEVVGRRETRNRLVVDTMWKGEPRDTMVVLTDLSSCTVRFEPGKKYLVFARRMRDGRLQTGTCRGTKSLEDAAEVLDLLSRLSEAESPDGLDRKIVDGLIEKLEAPAESLRAEAAKALGLMSILPDLTVPALVDLYEGGKESDRTAALWAGGRFSPEPVLPLFERAVLDPAAQVRVAALIFAPDFPGGSGFESLVAEALADTSSAVRGAAAVLLRREAYRSPEVIDALILGMADPDSTVRRCVAAALGEKGRLPIAAPKLAAAARSDPSPGVRGAALEALSRAGAGMTHEVAESALTDPVAEVRATALSVLDESAPDPARLVALLVARSRGDPSPRVRARALDLTGDYDLLPVLDAFLAALHDESPEIRASAVRFLQDGGCGRKLPRRFEREREVIVDSLAVVVREDPVEGLRTQAVTAVAMTAGPEQSVPILMRALEDEHRRTRVRAASGLLHIDPEDPNALAVLRDALHDEDLWIRREAERELERARRRQPD